MADQKITELDQITDAAQGDILPIVVDVSTVPETKSISTADLLKQVWILDSDTWEYVSATSFQITGKDVTSRFPKGTKLMLTQTTVKYFYVVSAVYSGGNTVVTITGGSDYTLVNAAITSPYYSYVLTPPGFPGWFNYTVAWTSTGTAPALGDGTLSGRFSLQGTTCVTIIRLVMGSTTTYGTGGWRFSTPIPAKSGWSAIGGIKAYDAGTAMHLVGMYVYNVNLFSSYVSGTAAALSVSTPFSWAASDIMDATITYEIG